MPSEPLIVFLVVWFIMVCLVNQLCLRSNSVAISSYRSTRWMISVMGSLLLTLVISIFLLAASERLSETEWTIVAEASLQSRPNGDRPGYLFEPYQHGQLNDQWLFFAQGSDSGELVPMTETTVIPLDGQNGAPRYAAYYGEPSGWWKYVTIPRESKYVIYVPPDSVPDES